MTHLTKEQAAKITEITSEIYPQGNKWVMKEIDLDSGVTRLTRGLNEKSARKKLSNWRKEKLELLLRSNKDAKAYALRDWHDNPDWDGGGIWRWSQQIWYTTKEEAEQALQKRQEKDENRKFEIFETSTSEIPGHFVVH